MITHFSVKNFRCFNDWTHFTLTSDKKYTFNDNAVNNNAIQHAMLFGENGEGKSNLGLAMLELINHISQKKVKYPELNHSFLNADSDESVAEFRFTFNLDDSEVVYEYGKSASRDIVYESLVIDHELALKWDKRESSRALIELDGADSLNTQISENVTSLVTYVLNNASLLDTQKNAGLLNFSQFVDKMAFFKTMSSVNQFAGAYPTQYQNISQQIIEEYGVDNLQRFLSEFGIDVTLISYTGAEGQKIAQVSKNKQLDFFSIASSGTFALVILFVWLKKMENGEVSFAYIDEFDAFYHHKLAKKIAKRISQLSVQTILSTHNTSIMSNSILRPDCYFELKNKQVNPLYKLSDREIRKAHNLEKMYRSGAFAQMEDLDE